MALVLALAKRPDLLLLDEPLASLDPLARREFLRTLMDAVAESGMTVLLSSHIIGDLERVCDYLIILSAAHVQLMGDIGEIVQTHKRLIGPRQDETPVASVHTVIEASHTDRQTTLLVRSNGPIFDPSWEVQDVSLEDIVLAYLLGQQVRRVSPSLSTEAQQGMEVSNDLAHLASTSHGRTLRPGRAGHRRRLFADDRSGHGPHAARQWARRLSGAAP